jgi:hypothetical protein
MNHIFFNNSVLKKPAIKNVQKQYVKIPNRNQNSGVLTRPLSSSASLRIEKPERNDADIS